MTEKKEVNNDKAYAPYKRREIANVQNPPSTTVLSVCSTAGNSTGTVFPGNVGRGVRAAVGEYIQKASNRETGAVDDEHPCQGSALCSNS